jgi:hypothetical protein
MYHDNAHLNVKSVKLFSSFLIDIIKYDES